MIIYDDLALEACTQRGEIERGREGGRERIDVGIICVIIYDDLALEAWSQREEGEREGINEREDTVWLHPQSSCSGFRKLLIKR